MKAANNKGERMIKTSEKDLLSLVAEKLKNRVLFADKLEQTKEYLKTVTAAK